MKESKTIKIFSIFFLKKMLKDLLGKRLKIKDHLVYYYSGPTPQCGL